MGGVVGAKGFSIQAQLDQSRQGGEVGLLLGAWISHIIEDWCLKLIRYPIQMGRQEATLITPEQGLLLEVTNSHRLYHLTGRTSAACSMENLAHQVRLEAAGGGETASHLVFCFPYQPTLRFPYQLTLRFPYQPTLRCLFSHQTHSNML